MFKQIKKYFAISALSLGVVFSLSQTAQAEKINYGMTDDHMGGYTFPGAITLTTTATSEYIWRGLSYSDETPVVQGGLDYTHESGFYLGVWGSIIDTGEHADNASSQVDFKTGMLFDLGADFIWDVGAIYHMYPGTDDRLDSYNFYEYQMSLSRDFGVADIRLGLNYAPNFFADSGNGLYSQFDVKVPIYDDFYVDAHYGYQTVARDNNFGFPNYGEWSTGMGYNVYGLDLSLRYHDTDLDESTCNDRCDGVVSFTVGRTFELWSK